MTTSVHPTLQWLLGPRETGTGRDVASLLLRLGVGLSMALNHGWGTWRGVQAGGGADFPDPLGLGGTASMALMAFAELLCALAVAAGLLTRLVVLPPLFGLGVAFFVFHASDPFHEKELAFLYLLGYAAVLALGAGRFSLDRLLAGRLLGTTSSQARRLGTAALALAVATALPATGETLLQGDLPRQGNRPREEIPGVDSLYGDFQTSDGARLRTILTTPEGREGPFPAILFVQWLSCDTVELPASMDHGWARMMRGVAARSGWAMLRTEKAGVGDSRGPDCRELDYETELRHHREALAHLLRSRRIDPSRVVIFGASMGATMAPLVAAEHDVAGVVVWGGGAKTWIECTLGFERRFRELSSVAAEEMTSELKLISEFLVEYLVRGRSPAEIATSDAELGRGWHLLVGTEGETHYGRSIAFHQQAQAQDWAAAWERLRVPVLVLFGEYDWYEDAAGHALIADLVNRNQPGLARLRIFPGLDHHFNRFESPEEAVSGTGTADAEPVVEEILTWLRGLGSGGSRDAPAPPETRSEDSAAAASSWLRRALSVMGEPQALERFGPFQVRVVGTLDKGAEGQGFSPEAPSPGPYEEIFVVDPAADRIAWEYREERYDGTYEAFREAYLASDERLIVVHDPPLAIPARSRRFAEERRRLTRRIPHLALAELLERSPRLRLESTAGSPPRVLGSLADGTLLEAEIDPEQGVLERLTYVAHLSGKGDTEVTWWFDDYRPVKGLGLFPFRYGSTVGTLPYTDMTVQSVEPGGLEKFTAPAEYRQIPEQRLDEAEGGDPPPLELQEIEPGVYRVPEVRSGFAPLVVAFENSVAVVDAPASFPILGKIPAEETDPAPHFSWHSERLVEAIQRAFPHRPLRYLILTHGHEDHLGGVRAFVAAGATVLAAPAVRPVVERLVALPAAQVGDRLAGMEGATLRFEAVAGPRTLGDGPRRIELFPLGDNPHAQGMLAVHLPAHQALFVSDLITPEPLAVYPRPAHAALDRFLARWIAESALELDRVLAMHGAPHATPEHLAQARGSS